MEILMRFARGRISADRQMRISAGQRAAYGMKSPGSSRPKRTAERFDAASAPMHFVGQNRAWELAREFMGLLPKAVESFQSHFDADGIPARLEDSTICRKCSCPQRLINPMHS
ncbi:MAG TPA: hypothetical protein VMO78_18450 [Rhizomicrobium sp.]|nr:hypothetical protein [Rhizomicrobium sp.]